MLHSEREIQIELDFDEVPFIVKTETIGKIKQSRNVTQHYWQLRTSQAPILGEALARGGGTSLNKPLLKSLLKCPGVVWITHPDIGSAEKSYGVCKGFQVVSLKYKYVFNTFKKIDFAP